MSIEDTATNPVDGDDTAVATVTDAQEVETEGQENEAELDEDGNPIEGPPADDSEEIELEGQKYKVPKAVKPLLMMQADYTRKTQELAEQRKAVEAERETVQQASQAELHARAQIVAIDDRLSQYARVDWDAWEEQDPFAAQKGFREFQQLQGTRQQTVGQLAHLAHQRTTHVEAEKAKQLSEAYATLQRDIPGYSPELGAKLQDFGIKTFGFSADELAEFTDARMVKVLHAAMVGATAQKQQQKAQTHVAAQQAKPAAKVGGAAPKQGLDDRLSTDEWLKRRNEQLRKNGGR